MITITPDNQIDRDGEIIGNIIGETAWMKSKQPGVIIGQIKRAAGINGLAFEIVDTPEEEAKLSPPISAAAGVDNDSETEPAASCDDLAAGNTFTIGADWGTPGTPYFARCFINHHGNDAYSAYCKANNI